MKKETRILTKEDAKAFIQNMQWFAGMGNVTVKPLLSNPNKVMVTATKTAWQNWVM